MEGSQMADLETLPKTRSGEHALWLSSERMLTPSPKSGPSLSVGSTGSR